MWTLWSVFRVRFRGIETGGAMNKRQVGAAREETAVSYLADKQYKILERNFVAPYGEIDIIAEKEGVLVFCEVKYRGSDRCGSPFEAVDARKQKRICRAALFYYAGHGFTGERPCRFDVIAVHGDGIVEHLENAFAFTGW